MTLHRTVVSYGGTLFEIFGPEIGLALNKNGVVILGPNAPELITVAMTNRFQANP